jgi:hypothetical protein
MAPPNPQFVGWTALLSGVVGVIGFVCLILLFVVGEPFGTVNDILATPTALLVLPLLLALYRLHAVHNPVVALVALLVGIAGFVAAAVGSGALALGRIDFTTSLVFGIGGFGLIGLWLLLTSGMGLRSGALPGTVAWAGLLLAVTPTFALLAMFRAGSVATALSGMAGQMAAPLSLPAYVFLALGFISYAALPFWIMWVGRLFLSGRLGIPAAVAVAH